MDRRKPLLNKDDEILLPVVTWPTQIWSAKMAGLNVRLVDVNPETLNIDLDDLERRITPNTKAIFLVHLLGNPCQMDRILTIAEKQIYCSLKTAVRLWAQNGTASKLAISEWGAFSFFFSHHMVTMEGGMVTCKDHDIADQLRILRRHGWLRNVENTSNYMINHEELDPRYAFVNWGFNLRPTELNAGFGLHQLQKLPAFNARREILANKFFHFIDQTQFLSRTEVHPLAQPSWLALPVMVQSDAPFQKQCLVDYLEGQGVETRPIVAGNLACHPVADLFEEMFEGSYPGGDIIHRQGFYLGLSPMVSDASMDRLLDCLQQFLIKY